MRSRYRIRLPEVLNELREALESNGFTAAEAERIIIPVPQGTMPLGLQAQTVRVSPDEIDAAAARIQVAALAGKARIDAAKGEITVVVPLDKAETEKLTSCVKTPEAKARWRKLSRLCGRRRRHSAALGPHASPRPTNGNWIFSCRCSACGKTGMLFEFESTFLLEHPWKLSEKDAALSQGYNPLVRPGAESRAGGRRSQRRSADQRDRRNPGADFVGTLHQQVLALGAAGDWTLESLVAWLDRHIDHQDIPAGESAEFLRKVIRGLLAKHGITDLSLLALDRFRLRNEIEARIREHRDSERKAAFQQFLLPDSTLAVSAERAINFKTMIYEPSWLYEGGFQFNKHYFGPKPGELREKTPRGELTEEFKCAQFLDGRPEVKFWVRNLVRKPSSFRLQTSTDWFYPDFLCQLTDGRVLAVEYKGKDRYTADDAEEKRVIAAVWASRSGGRCLFVMPTDSDFSVTAVVKVQVCIGPRFIKKRVRKESFFLLFL